MFITKIEVQKKRKDRYNIFIDGEFRFGLDEGVVARLGLYEKKEINEDEIEQIEKEEVRAKAFNAAVNFLKTRERSKKEIRDKLKTKEYSESVIEKVLDKMERLDLVNDKRFAQMFVNDRMKLKPKGKKVLSLELVQKGVSKDTIEEVLRELIDEDKELELAEKVYQKAIRKYGVPDNNESKQKIVKYLLGKGFAYNIVEEVFSI